MDSIIWREWLAQHAQKYQAFYYNVRLGQTRPAAQGLTEAETRAWELINFLRADAIGSRKGELIVFEVKQLAVPRDLFQALGYLALLQREVASFTQTDAALVCFRTDQETRRLGRELKVSVYETGR